MRDSSIVVQPWTSDLLVTNAQAAGDNYDLPILIEPFQESC
jgi:hypothetical protein